MNTVIIILLVVLAIAVVLLFAICGFLFNQVIWYKPIKLPVAKGEVEDDFAKDHRKAEEEFGKMPFEKLTLTASNGEKIYARLLLPEKSNGRMIIACHGALSSGICAVVALTTGLISKKIAKGIHIPALLSAEAAVFLIFLEALYDFNQLGRLNLRWSLITMCIFVSISVICEAVAYVVRLNAKK